MQLVFGYLQLNTTLILMQNKSGFPPPTTLSQSAASICVISTQLNLVNKCSITCTITPSYQAPHHYFEKAVNVNEAHLFSPRGRQFRLSRSSAADGGLRAALGGRGQTHGFPPYKPHNLSPGQHREIQKPLLVKSPASTGERLPTVAFVGGNRTKTIHSTNTFSFT